MVPKHPCPKLMNNAHVKRELDRDHIASPKQCDLRLWGPPSGQGASGGTHIRDRRLPADLRVDSRNRLEGPNHEGRAKAKLLHYYAYEPSAFHRHKRGLFAPLPSNLPKEHQRVLNSQSSQAHRRGYTIRSFKALITQSFKDVPDSIVALITQSFKDVPDSIEALITQSFKDVPDSIEALITQSFKDVPDSSSQHSVF
ncbi:hypothetical protein PoB_006315200 [Plakobranchus ocellatus]|uniref:Uncharacterized protein n=1 Tax=Plakobranchus ocellatus TaxID=259542 RepID=A0AAV4CXL4_9GAST|nr:hypothetical protein PoB_006315200 [Plakobranchus ocellatus]